MRLIGVDTPETKDPRKAVQCFGVEASAHTMSLLGSRTPVRLVYDVERFDRFGRTLAYVYREGDGLFVNAALVAEGYAQVAAFPPNVAHAEELIRLARSAREDGRGLWSACEEGPAEEPPAQSGSATANPPAEPSRAGPCDASYPDVCIPPAPPDLDCGNIDQRRFRVLPPDPHRFDGSDDDGLGCEGWRRGRRRPVSGSDAAPMTAAHPRPEEEEGASFPTPPAPASARTRQERPAFS